jgi:HK97 family phage portal protein
MASARQFISRIFAPLIRAGEGDARPGPFHLPISGGWLPAGSSWNWWQQGYSLDTDARSAIVEACISAYAQTVASLPGGHWRRNNRGGVDQITNSALARILRSPNAYQTPSDFLLNAVRDLYLTGNSFAVAYRNERFEIDELHLMDARQSSPCVVRNRDDGDAEIFYRLSGNAVIEQQLGGQQIIAPARDVLHLRLHNDRRYPRPLFGESPLLAAWDDIVASGAMTQQQLNFYMNMARPSAVLSTDLVLNKDQVQQLRDRWNEQAKGLHAGGVPILTAGLKVAPWTTIPPRDAQTAELSRQTDERIALAFRIPLQVLGLGGGPLGSTTALMEFWLATSLGFCLNHIEEAIDKLFGLRGEPEEYCEFDTEALLRSNQKDRIDMLVRATQGGVYSPNEARNQEGLDSVPYGDEPRVQQQVVPLSAAAAIPAAPAPAPPPTAAPAAVKNYQAAVQLGFEAQRARRNSGAAPHAPITVDPSAPLIRETTIRPVRTIYR